MIIYINKKFINLLVLVACQLVSKCSLRLKYGIKTGKNLTDTRAIRYGNQCTSQGFRAERMKTAGIDDQRNVI